MLAPFLPWAPGREELKAHPVLSSSIEVTQVTEAEPARAPLDLAVRVHAGRVWGGAPSVCRSRARARARPGGLSRRMKTGAGKKWLRWELGGPRVLGRGRGPEEVARGAVLCAVWRRHFLRPSSSWWGKSAGDWCIPEEGKRVRRGSAGPANCLATGGAGGAPESRYSPAGASAGVAAGFSRTRPRPLCFAQFLCSVLQVYPEPRSESECLSNIREFLRGCGASLRLEVSGCGCGCGCGCGGGGAGGRGRWPGLDGRGTGPRPGSRAAPGCERGPRAGRSRLTEPHTLPFLHWGKVVTVASAAGDSHFRQLFVTGATGFLGTCLSFNCF